MRTQSYERHHAYIFSRDAANGNSQTCSPNNSVFPVVTLSLSHVVLFAYSTLFRLASLLYFFISRNQPEKFSNSSHQKLKSSSHSSEHFLVLCIHLVNRTLGLFIQDASPPPCTIYWGARNFKLTTGCRTTTLIQLSNQVLKLRTA